MAHVTATFNVRFVRILTDNIVIQISLEKVLKSQLNEWTPLLQTLTASVRLHLGRPSANFNSKCDIAFSTSLHKL